MYSSLIQAVLTTLMCVFGLLPSAINIGGHWYRSDHNITLCATIFLASTHWLANRIGRPPSSVRTSAVRRPHSLNIFSKTTGPIKVKFQTELLWDGERKFVQKVLVTWPSWPPCPYMVKTKTWKNLLTRNQKVDNLETWYTASGTWILPSLFK